MKIKHWDELTQKWIIDSASNASNLELSNPSYLSDGKSVSVDHGFTKIANKLVRMEKNLAWIYLNGAIGGGSGGGTGGDLGYTIDILEGSTVYTAYNSVTINVTINSGSIKKPFTLIAKNLTTGKELTPWRLYSLTRTQITISNITSTTNFELTAYDSSSNYTTPKYIKIVTGALAITSSIDPLYKTLYIGEINDIPLNYTLTNNMGTVSKFELYANGKLVATKDLISISRIDFSYSARTLIFSNFQPFSGQTFNFVAKATTIFGTDTITATSDSFGVTISDSTDLLIITENVSDFLPESPHTYDDLTTVIQGSRLIFPYYLSYLPTTYNSFILSYSVHNSTDINTVLDSGIIENIPQNTTGRVLSINVPWDVVEGQYFIVDLKAWAASDPEKVKTSKIITFKIRVADVTDLTANNDFETLLAYFSKITGFPSSGVGTWTYKIPTSGKWKYSGAFRSDTVDGSGGKFPDGVKLTLKDVNGQTNGFLSESASPGEALNQIPGIKLEGESYGYLEVANQMFPNTTQLGTTFFQPSGFCVSFTYKATHSSDPTETIVSLGNYNGNELLTGIEISLEQAVVRIGAADTLTCKLPQGELITIDIDVSTLDGEWYFKIFVNGTMSAVTRVSASAIDWRFQRDIYLGCRYNQNGVRSHYSNVTFYDIKIYTSSQTESAIVQNYMSATEQASLISGFVDQNLDKELRDKNFFNSEGTCIIWDYTAQEYYSGGNLYSIMAGHVADSTSFNTVYPVVLIKETATQETNFKVYSNAIYSTDTKAQVMKAQFPVEIVMTTKYGDTVLKTPDGIVSDRGVRIGLQGTSSLSYTAKNFELYCGDKNAAGDPLLFLPTDDWLPENEFTLKADVMDSSHVNNVVIGKIINGEVTNGTNIIKPMEATPPMGLSDSNWSTVEQATNIKGKIKHTSDGFPVLLFIQYAPIDGNVQQPEFKGIYNFNLGRYAHYNLGLKVLKSYTKVENRVGPSVVNEYEELPSIWNTGSEDGVYSIEINQNTSAEGAFQQDSRAYIEDMGNVEFSSRGTSEAYNKVQYLYTQLANMALNQIPKYTLTDSGSKRLLDFSYDAELYTSTKTYSINEYAYNSSYQIFKSKINNNVTQVPATAESNDYWLYTGDTIRSFYNLDKNQFYNFARFNTYMNWNNAVTYFVLGIIFGLVDSMCKNLTLRNWGSNEWFTAFYDMDTAFGLNNMGHDTVAYTAHLHRWENYNRPDTTLTTYREIKNYPQGEYTQDYASWWNRIWEVLENLVTVDGANIGDKKTIEQIYTDLRINLFQDPDTFIETYYQGYTDQIGSIIFNLDYKVKYLKIGQTFDEASQTYIDTTDFSQLKFLHGNRVMHVKDWFRKRIYFLDGIYGINSILTNYAKIESPLTSFWNANKATGGVSSGKFITKLSATSRVLFQYALETHRDSFWIDETPRSVVMPLATGQMAVSIYANDYITLFDNIKAYTWTDLNRINLPLLTELNLSGLNSVPGSAFLKGGAYELTSLKKLNLSNVKFTDTNTYSLLLTKCSKLEELDISYSNITYVELPESPVLKTYNLSGTTLTELTLTNQAFLSDLNLDNCNYLKKITLINCNKLTILNLPSNVETVIISNCALLESLSLLYTSTNNSISKLSKISIDGCPNLKSFDISGQNNPNLVVELVGATNLERLILTGTSTSSIILPALYEAGVSKFTSLKYIDISRTAISAFKYVDNMTLDYLELSTFPNLQGIIANDCKQLTVVKCTNDPNNPIELDSRAFANCNSLTRVYGHFKLKGIETFKGCSQLVFNEQDAYSSGTVDFINLNTATNITIDDTNQSLLSTFEGCSNFTYDDFNYLKIRIGQQVTSIEAMFKGCSGITGALQYDMFRTCPNLLTIKEAFSGCKLTGRFYSRTSNYSSTDSTTWGILDFIPKVQDAESAFENNLIEYIDNNVFAPRIINGVTQYYDLVRIDRMFRGCTYLTTCKDTRINEALTPEDGELNSETFFTNLVNLLSPYPIEVFANCTKVVMRIINDGNNTFLFHRNTRLTDPLILTGLIYSGITLKGEIKVNTFGGQTNTIVSSYTGKTYYIPTFSTIQYPFNYITSNNTTIKLSEMSEIFRNINTSLYQAVGVFYKLKLDPSDSGVIPADMFKGCTKLNSIESLFSGLDLNNNGSVYEFPATYNDSGVTKGMFEDCVSLNTTKNLFYGCYNLKIRLMGERFINCNLTNVSSMFENSGVIETIPYKLFYMVKTVDGKQYINQSISNMENIFKGCWNLGYQSDRILSIGESLGGNRTSTWSDHLVINQGTPVSYSLPMSSITKSYNFDRDDRLYIPLTASFYDKDKYTYDSGTDTYTLYDVSGITFYKKQTDGSYLQTSYNGYSSDEVYTNDGTNYILYVKPSLYVKNIRYNPGEYAFDDWYLDGFGWEGITAANPDEQSELDNLKSILYDRYFVYDARQKEIYNDVNKNTYYKETVYRNYMIPTDLFRYCSTDATLAGVLKDLNWNKSSKSTDAQTGISTIVSTSEVEGLFGRIPVRLLEALSNNKEFDSVFSNTRFEPFVGLKRNGLEFVRGIMFPPDLFRYNSEITILTSMFNNIVIPVGVDINSDLLYGNSKLYSIAGMFSNCQFNKRMSIAYIDTLLTTQISYDMFKYNLKLVNASSLFAVYISEGGVTRGLLKIDQTLFDSNINMNDISNMFYNNIAMSGAVPPFKSAYYPILSSVSGYLFGVVKANITNASSIIADDPRLAPAEWLTN